MYSKNILNGLVIMLYYLLIASSVLSFLSLPFGMATIEMDGKSYHEWSLRLFILLLFSIGAIVLLIMSINKLRKASKIISEETYFSGKLPSLLDKSGKYMIFSGLIFLFTDIVDFFMELFTASSLKFVIDTNAIFLLLLLILGVFLKIQASTLKEALLLKSENDLTI